MSTTIASNSRSILIGRKLTLARAGWWVLFVFYSLFTIASLIQQFRIIKDETITDAAIPYIIGINVVESIISWVLAIILFAGKSNDWSVLLVTIMFLSGGSPLTFWHWVFEGDNAINLTSDGFLLSQLVSIPFSLIATMATTGVFLTFPTGQWISPKARGLFWVTFVFEMTITIITFVLNFAIAKSTITWDTLVDIYQFVSFQGSLWVNIFRLLAGYLLYLHYRKMQNSVQRQQIKWVVTFFVMSVCVTAILTLFYAPIYFRYFLNLQESFIEFYADVGTWASLPSSIVSLGLVIAFSVSVFRYRLWDVEILINKTLVYSGLTAGLGGLIFVSVTLVGYAIKEWFGEESSVWAVVISALPVATVFNPLRDRLQKWVDRYFKPEEVDFSNSFIEFKPEVQALLTTSRIMQIVSSQVKKQLNVDFATVYLLKEDHNLHQASTTPNSTENKKLVLKEKPLTQLKDGKVVVDDDGVPYSLLVPLTVPRARVPDFLGVIVLGRRLNGKGYSSKILNNLQSLGAEAGKAIYLSQLNEQAKQKKKRAKK